MSALRIRMYNVLFGDAVLVSVPGANGDQHILFDVGNVLAGEGGSDAVFKPVIEDIVAETGGEVDLYVMTHEHMDHVQGLPYAGIKLEMPLKAKHVWITASAGPGYYEAHPDARRKKLDLDQAYLTAAAICALRGARYAGFSGMLANNDARSTKKCVEYVRTQVAKKAANVRFVSRDDNVGLRQPIAGVKFEILAPEEDTSDYYGRGKPFSAGSVGDPAPGAAQAAILPPAGVDVGAFEDLLASREEGFLNTLLQIDRAANNTSLVLRMHWQGRVLLFTGDAENKSWAFMAKHAGLGPVDFLKLGHHGSSNGMPIEYVATLLPNSGNRKRHVGVSTCVGCYNNVPYRALMNELEERAVIHDTREVDPGSYVDIKLTALA